MDTSVQWFQKYFNPYFLIWWLAHLQPDPTIQWEHRPCFQCHLRGELPVCEPKPPGCKPPRRGEEHPFRLCRSIPRTQGKSLWGEEISGPRYHWGGEWLEQPFWDSLAVSAKRPMRCCVEGSLCATQHRADKLSKVCRNGEHTDCLLELSVEMETAFVGGERVYWLMWGPWEETFGSLLKSMRWKEKYCLWRTRPVVTQRARPRSTGGTCGLIITGVIEGDGMLFRIVLSDSIAADEGERGSPAGQKASECPIVNRLWRGPPGKGLGAASSLLSAERRTLSPATARKRILPTTQLGVKADSCPVDSFTTTLITVSWAGDWAEWLVQACLDSWAREALRASLPTTQIRKHSTVNVLFSASELVGVRCTGILDTFYLACL